MKPAFIWDLDGTLADGDHRLHHITKTVPKNWTAYFAECADDKPIQHNIEILKSLAMDFKIFIVTGRSDEVRDETMGWLMHHVLAFEDHEVYMRKAGDHRDDTITKIEALADIRDRGFHVMAAFEDRDRCVAAWRAAGVPCLQVAPGSF